MFSRPLNKKITKPQLYQIVYDAGDLAARASLARDPNSVWVKPEILPEVLPEEQKLNDFLITNHNINGLEEFTTAVINYEKCGSQAASRSQKYGFYSPSSCISTYDEYKRTQKACFTENEVEEIPVNKSWW
jgi:hypothetical protein